MLAPSRRLSDHLARIELPLPLDGLPSVNCYAVLGEDDVTLVDPGWSSADTLAALTGGLAHLGRTLDDVRQVVVTHHHWDHYTQAVSLRRSHGIPVHLGRGEAPSIRAWEDLPGAFPLQVGMLRDAGADTLAAEVAAIREDVHERAMDFTMPSAWLDDGQVVDCGGTSLRVIATPGHTRGHVVFEDSATGALLTGDHVLPRTTPSIAYERAPDPRSLTTYLASLRLVAGLGDRELLPAHGEATTSAGQRALELLEHHRARLSEIAALRDAGHATPAAIAARMRWTRRERRLEELETVHRMTAVLEVAAHLDHLDRLEPGHSPEGTT